VVEKRKGKRNCGKKKKRGDERRHDGPQGREKRGGDRGNLMGRSPIGERRWGQIIRTGGRKTGIGLY